MRFSTVSIVGRSNVGKSTFLNLVLGSPLSIVSPKPQTTRDAVLGVVVKGETQLAFLDSPGFHEPRSELGRRMNQRASEALSAGDTVVFMTDIGPRAPAGVRPEDSALLERMPELRTRPTLLVINKVDLVRDKRKLLPILQAYQELGIFSAAIPISAAREDGVDGVLDELCRLAEQGSHAYDADTLTDRPLRFFAAEYVREQVLLHSDREVPHAVAVSIDSFEESERLIRIAATIHVEKPGQRRILVGRGGSLIKQIGTEARKRITELADRKVHLELFVRVSPRWRNAPRQLAELGYETATEIPPHKPPNPSARRTRDDR